MKVRTPALKGEALAPPDFTVPKETNSVTYKVKVITPIYGGGVKAGEPDKDMPIRASAIRGQLRYWWRFLKMNDPVEDKRLAGENLFKEERRIWGGMGDEDETHASKVFVTISNITNIESQPVCIYTKKKRNGRIETDRNGNPKYNQPIFLKIDDITVPQYALFPAQGKPPSARDYDPIQDQPHKIILPDVEFDLKISVSTSLREEVAQAVRWWACFGGIGARTRRGLGSVEVISDTENSFAVVGKEEATVYGCKLIKLSATNPIDAWNKAVGLLQDFRQGIGVGRNQKRVNGVLSFRGRNNDIPNEGTSRWPEPDSIREIANTYSKPSGRRQNCNTHKPTHRARISFPRAQFGLPIIFKFNQKDENCGDPQQSELRPLDYERMSSPLILKAIKTDGNYKAIALKLPIQNISTLWLKNHSTKPSNQSREKESEWEEKNWEQWPSNWWHSSKAKDVKPINDYKGDNNATNALDAFMNFFAKGGE